MSPTPVASRWLLFPRPQPQATSRLFCFPYAGGAARIFSEWPKNLPSSVEVCTVELPGRGTRLREESFTKLPLLVTAIAEEVLPYLNKPFSFYGHSMGALIGFELARHLRRNHLRGPQNLFVSGCCAPQMPNDNLPDPNVSPSEFVRVLRGLNGTPSRVFEHPELLQLVLPMIKADFEMVFSYSYSTEPPLASSIVAFGGALDEQVSRAALEGWADHTNVRFLTKMLPGGHFFLQESRSLLLKMISHHLES